MKKITKWVFTMLVYVFLLAYWDHKLFQLLIWFTLVKLFSIVNCCSPISPTSSGLLSKSKIISGTPTSSRNKKWTPKWIWDYQPLCNKNKETPICASMDNAETMIIAWNKMVFYVFRFLKICNYPKRNNQLKWSKINIMIRHSQKLDLE